MKTIIGIGPHVDRKNNFVTGLAMMHEMTLNVLELYGFKIKRINTNGIIQSDPKRIAKPSLLRYVNYFFVFFNIIIKLITSYKAIIYINPAPTKLGLCRDGAVVKLAYVFGHKVVFHQFGALFANFYSALSTDDKLRVEKIYNKVESIIVEGEFAKTQYNFLLNPQKIVVINNGLPESSNVVIKEPKTFSLNKPFELLYMNNMIESKGYMDVLKAMDILINERKANVNCTFAGKFISSQDDEYFSSIEVANDWFKKFIKDKKLDKHVSYYPALFDQEKANAFMKANIFILPSYYIYEGQPTAILEALSYGCIPIVTKYRLIPDMVDDATGIFVDPKNPECIADAIEKLIENPKLYRHMSNKCIERYQNDFTQEIYAKKIINLINTI